jgi:hypothetical protein
MNTLDSFIGFGSTADKKFTELVEVVLDNATFLKDKEEISHLCDIITTTYFYGGRKYELWMQVRNNTTPNGMLFTYGFSKR